jgi:hypothetical protein
MSRTGLAGVASLALIAMAFGPCADERLSNEEFRFAAQATASASILRIEDVPAGWRIAPHGAIDPGSSGESGPAGECPVFANEEEGWAGQSAYAESDVLIGPTHEINTSASVFREAGAAQEILSDYFDLLEACSGQILDFARGDTDFGPGDEFSFHEIEVLELGRRGAGHSRRRSGRRRELRRGRSLYPAGAGPGDVCVRGQRGGRQRAGLVRGRPGGESARRR